MYRQKHKLPNPSDIGKIIDTERGHLHSSNHSVASVGSLPSKASERGIDRAKAGKVIPKDSKSNPSDGGSFQSISANIDADVRTNGSAQETDSGGRCITPPLFSARQRNATQSKPQSGRYNNADHSLYISTHCFANFL